MKQYSAEEKREYFKKQRSEMQEAIIKGVETCYKDGTNFMQYLQIMNRFHDYSVRNCMLIAMQCPNASMIAGFNDWHKKFNRNVKKGAKAIRIYAPTPKKITVLTKDEDGNEVEENASIPYFKAVSVFDVSQTEGADIPQICKQLDFSVSGYDSIINKLKKATTAEINFVEDEDMKNGCYYPKEHKICIKAGMSEAQTVKTLIHEIAHSILHDDVFCEIPRNIKEMQAESVAYMVCSDLGIDSASYSFEYLASWAQKDMKELSAQMDIVRKTADMISNKVMA